MAFSFLDETNLFDRYTTAKQYTDSLTKPFPEFERIARNRPFEGIDPNYPKTTDGTTASIIRKTPRRVIQQLPTGKVIIDNGEDWLGVVADYIYTDKILPFANEEYDLIQKCWSVVEAGLSFGFCATYTPFLNHDGYFCPDVTGIYWGDLALQPGKKSGRACSYLFFRTYWQPEDIDSLIEKETKLAASAKKRKEKYESSWDLPALKKIKKMASAKDQQGTTPIERERQNQPNTSIELIVGLQDGVGAKFYTFHQSSKTIVRTKTNKDPRGKKPVDFMYGDIDGSNPMGRGIIELVGGLQNLIDSDMQMYQYNRALMLAPPIVLKGSTPKSKVKFVPNAIIKLASPNDTIETLEIDTTAVANYPQLYQLQQSQLFNLVQSPQSSISTTDSALGQGKTPTALNQQKATISIDDNYILKMFEAWFEGWSETAVNIYFAERSGIEELQLDEDAADRLRKLATQGKFDPTLLSDDNKIKIDYDTETPVLKFRIDASTSKMKDDAQQLQGLEMLNTTLDQSPVLQQIVPPEKLISLWNSLVAVAGVQDPEELSIDLKEFQQQAQQAQAQQQTVQMQPPVDPGMQQPSPQSMPPAATPQPQMPQDTTQGQPSLDPQDQQIIAQLQQLGFSDQQISQAIQMLNAGYNEQDVISMLQGGQQ